MLVEKVISGGQTGVDRAALDAARAAGLPIGGWCPRGRRAEDGVIADRYPLSETPSEEYAERTAWNVRDSDATLIVARGELTGGTALTRDEAERRGQPWLHIEDDDAHSIDEIRAWLKAENVGVLNVAGPRESAAEDVYEHARSILDRLFSEIGDV